MPTAPDPLAVLRARFGHERLYPLQQGVVGRLLAGGDALVVMPTGSGKSLCYQLPALAQVGPGTTLVFSPLIALMQDQVSALRGRGIAAEYINSTLDRQERLRRYERLGRGEYELVYATPERMHKPEFTAALDAVPGGVRLLAIDEAHCISCWGHDFRPAYQEVGRFRQRVGAPPTVALTATATAAVRADIRRTLGRSDEQMPLFASSIDRPNLELVVREAFYDDDKLAAILEVARTLPGTGIVYFALIQDLERMEARLRAAGAGLELLVYHGQLTPAQKRRVHARFIAAAPDDHLLLLATPAFGMGVDKPDIRFIVHAQMPGSIEAYYQEVGRAGRDGQPSTCVLLTCPDDLAIQQQFVEWQNPAASLIEEAARRLEHWPHGEFDVDDLRPLVISRDRGDRRAEACLLTLEKLGVIEAASRTDHYRFVRPLVPGEVDPQAVADKRQRDLRRLLEMLELTRTADIRRRVVEYFELDARV